MHVVGHRAASVWHIFLNEVIMVFVINSKLIIASRFVIAKGRCYCEIFRTSVKNYFAWLTRAAQIDSTYKDCIVS